MIRVDGLIQGQDDWFKARLGIPTASMYSKIITPTGKPSSESDSYMNKLVAEYVTGEVDSGFKNDWMKRGNELEPDARAMYSFLEDVKVEETGIVYKDEERLIACSPDGLIAGRNGGLEIKCPKASTFVSYVLANELPPIYKPQVQGSLYVTGCDYWDFMAYHPDFKPFLYRVLPDPVFIKTFEILSDKFIEKMLDKREVIQSYYDI